MVLPFKNEAQEGCAKKNEFIKVLIFLELGFIYGLQFRQTKNFKLAKNVT